MRALPPELTPVQQTILACVQSQTGRFSRSGLAKLLVGSHSSRAVDLSENPEFGRLTGHGRKEITSEIDILLQQGYLALNRDQNIVLAPADGRVGHSKSQGEP